jgi:site-specific DNA-methyltransferase (adenine-specific)
MGCPEGGTVLDPFAGSGTTLVVCRKSGRKAIGIELIEVNIEEARRRLIHAETPLFQGFGVDILGE